MRGTDSADRSIGRPKPTLRWQLWPWFPGVTDVSDASVVYDVRIRALGERLRAPLVSARAVSPAILLASPFGFTTDLPKNAVTGESCMGAERRRDPRIRCSIPCELRVAGRSLEGKVRNVSASGLGVAADAPEIEQGDPVTVTLRVEGLAIEVHALVWHVRSPSRGTSEKGARVLGLVLSDTAPEFARLVERLGSKPPQPELSPPPPTAAAPLHSSSTLPSARGGIARARSALKAARPAPARTREYRIRIKQSGGPRTFLIVASGVSQDAAIAAVLREVGQGWIVLEVVPIS